MLHMNLNTLERAGTLRLRAACATTDFALGGRGPELSEPVRVTLTARCTVAGHVMVQGRMSTTLAQACRRCLEPVEQPFALPVRFLFVPADETGRAEDDGEVRTFPPHLVELDMTGPLREEFVLAAPLYAECRSDCKGLCPGCGSNRNLAPCECSPRHADARWDTLRALTNH